MKNLTPDSACSFASGLLLRSIASVRGKAAHTGWPSSAAATVPTGSAADPPGGGDDLPHAVTKRVAHTATARRDVFMRAPGWKKKTATA